MAAERILGFAAAGELAGAEEDPHEPWRGALAPDARRVTVVLDDRRWRQVLGRPQAVVRRSARAALRAAAAPNGAQVNVLLGSDRAIARLNRRFRGKRGPTNVLSFPGPGAGDPLRTVRSLGDVALAFETWLVEARSEGKRPVDHLAHLVVHGTLHLLGHDHGDEEEALRMEGLERLILARLGHPDPYPDLATEPKPIPPP